MKRIVKLNESDLARIVRKVIQEGTISKTVTIDCTKKTMDSLPMSSAQLTKYCNTKTKNNTSSYGGGSFRGAGAGSDW